MWYFLLCLPTLAVVTAGACMAGPLDLARQGYLECGSYDAAAKTCVEIAKYVPRADGRFDLISQQVIGTNPQIVMVYKVVAFEDGNQICAKYELVDFDTTEFFRENNKLGADEASRIRNLVREGMYAVMGKISCLTLRAEGDGFMAEYTTDGIADGRKTKTKWVKPDEGYRLVGSK